MKFPIIVNEHGDVSLYSSVEQVERDLEAVDVKNKEYVAYDAEGRILILTVVLEEKTGIFGMFPRSIEKVRLVETPGAEADGAELRALLVRFLNRINISLNAAEMNDLCSVVNAVVDKIGYSKN